LLSISICSTLVSVLLAELPPPANINTVWLSVTLTGWNQRENEILLLPNTVKSFNARSLKVNIFYDGSVMLWHCFVAIENDLTVRILFNTLLGRILLMGDTHYY